MEGKMGKVEVQTQVSFNELYDLYIECDTTPPEWLARMLGRSVRKQLTDEELRRAAIDSGIPFMFSVAEKDTRMIELLSSGLGLYILGVQGAGKTWMACRIAKGWLSEGMGSVRFVSSVRLLTEINDTYDNRGYSENQVLNQYSKYQLLIVDDLGKEVPSKWALSRLFTIFDTRYANAMPTIVTTQFSTSALAKRMAESGDTETAMAIVSRFKEKYKLLDMGSHDRRAEK